MMALAEAALPAPAGFTDNEAILSRLDSVLDNANVYDSMKRHRLTELHKREKHAATDEERYWINKNLYEEYAVYNADSAMTYVNKNHDLAQKLGDDSRRFEWAINRSFLLAVTGLLKESQDAIEEIDPETIPADLLASYFNQMSYLYSHYGNYLGKDRTSTTDYYVQSRAYQDSTFLHASPSDPLYSWYQAWTVLHGSDADRLPMIEKLKEKVDSSAMDTRTDAMNAYVLSRLYEKQDDTDNRIRYLAISAICDVMTANKDIASLQELGRLMLNRGDIDRASSYVSFCQRQAQDYHNRVRAFTLANLEKQIREEYGKRDSSQRLTMHLYLWILGALLLLMVAGIIVIIMKNRKLNDSRIRLSNLNKEMEGNIAELTSLREAQYDANTKLQEMNVELLNVNRQLRDSNIIKEEYVGQMFYICSDYINKLEAFRKDVSRKLKVGHLDALKDLVESSSMVQNELKEFYRSFDTIFLNLFPDFVANFNKLLRPDEQIVLSEGELLNTPLRIYALVRLGITDSVKIAALLHCSSQTVYNNRLRIRNKAIIPKDKFAETVRNLGESTPE